jgi:hypothetical protein
MVMMMQFRTEYEKKIILLPKMLAYAAAAGIFAVSAYGLYAFEKKKPEPKIKVSAEQKQKTEPETKLKENITLEQKITIPDTPIKYVQQETIASVYHEEKKAEPVVQVQQETIAPVYQEEKKAEPVVQEQHPQLIPEEKIDETIAKAHFLSSLRDPPDGQVYSHTVGELEQLLECKEVSDADKKYVKRIVELIKNSYRKQKGWEPIAYKKVLEYVKNEKKADIEKSIDDIVRQAEVVFVEGGRIDFFISVKDKGKTIFSSSINITPGPYFGGNPEEVIIRALKSAGYTD